MSYTATQILAKALVTLAIIVPAAWGIFRLWRTDVDVAQTISPKRIIESIAPKSLVIIRDPDSLYQEGEVRAVVEGAAIDEKLKTVSFVELSMSGSLKLDEPFEFRKYVLKFEHADTMIGLLVSAPEKGRIIREVKCSIAGYR